MFLLQPDEISNARFRLRGWELDDLPCVEEASREQAITKITSVPSKYSTQSDKAYIRRQQHRNDDGQAVSFTIEDIDAGKAVGMATLCTRPEDGVVGIGYWVVPSARGKGVANNAVQMLFAWADEQNISRIEGLTEKDNTASQKILLANGFVLQEESACIVINEQNVDAHLFVREADKL